MAIIGLHWEPADDIHMVEPVSGETTGRLLRFHVFVDDDTLDEPIRASDPLPPGVTVSFEPVFPFTQGKHGFKVDSESGLVTLERRPANTLPHNFILYAVVKQNGTEIDRTPRRIHIHKGLAPGGLMLSPRLLTIRSDQACHFTVLATFDDGVMADLTEDTAFNAEWSSPSAAIQFDPIRQGFISPTASGAVGTTASVTVRLPTFGGATDTAEVVVAQPWATPRPAQLMHGPGRDAIPSVRNILFIAEGFTADQEDLFFLTVLFIANSMATTHAISPYNRLLNKNRFNIWAAFIDSREEGISAKYPLTFVTDSDTERVTTHVPKPKAPPSKTGDQVTDVAMLIHQVGLPTVAESDPTGVGFNQKLNDWRAAYSAAHVQGVTQKIYLGWATYADHFLAQDQDTALGLVLGELPQAAKFDDGRGVDYSPSRASRTDLSSMLLQITDGPGGPNIGSNLWGALGKDSDLVIALCGGTRNSGTTIPDHLGDMVAIGMSESDALLIEQGKIVPHETPLEPAATVWLTVPHELGHVFNLGDEYGGTDPVAEGVDSLANAWNIQLATDAMTGPATVGDKIRWRWPRINAAGVLTKRIVPVFAIYEVTLRPGQGRPFKAGDTVHLRKLPFLVVSGTPEKPQLQEVSQPLKVIDKVRDVIAVQPVSGSLTPADWEGDAAILYRPNADFRLVSEEIVLHINDSRVPLNRVRPAAGAPPTTCTPFGDDGAGERFSAQPVPKNNRPPGLIFPRSIWYTGYLVGLWDGGLVRDCDFLHPAGVCMMRGERTPIGVDPLDKDRSFVYRLCPVCKYLLVEQLDPSLHAAIDREYDKDYPRFT